jgi:hypothetical protein
MTLRPLLAYAPWQARDAAVRALAPLFVVFAIAGLPLYAFMSSQELTDFTSDPRATELALQAYDGAVSLAMLIGAFLLMGNSSALDRDKLHVRFLFAHPVAPEAFYLQRFLVSLVVSTVIFAAVPLVFSWLAVPVPVLGTLKAYLVIQLLIGSLAALCGAITARDGLVLIITYIASNVLQQLDRAEQLAPWLSTLSKGLPPIGAMERTADALIAGTAIVTNELILVAGYALGLLLVALVIVKRAPLVR